MRNPESLFNHLVTFINSVEEGEIFQVSDLIKEVGPHETPSRWKNWNNNPYYTTRSYLSHVKNVEKFITRVSYGKYRVIKHIPKWFDLGHLMYIRGYGNGKYENGKYVSVHDYKGMSRQDILDKLDGKTQIQIEVQIKRPLPRSILLPIPVSSSESSCVDAAVGFNDNDIEVESERGGTTVKDTDGT